MLCASKEIRDFTVEADTREEAYKLAFERFCHGDLEWSDEEFDELIVEKA